MPICQKCHESFSGKVWIDGKYKHLYSRSYCLICSPWGQRLRSGPLPKDGSDPFENLTNERYPHGRRRVRPQVKICPQCQKTFTKKHRNLLCNTCKSQNARKKIKNELKNYKGNKCVSCHNTTVDILIFHHLDPEQKDFNLSAVYGSTKKDLLYKEADKCVLLCPNCHAEVHLGIRKLSL